MLTLYFSPGACSTASHIALEEIGLPYVERRTVIEKGENKVEAYLKINPRGRVPALVIDDGRVLVENTAILIYLGRRFPESGLLPTDPFQEALCISTMVWFSNAVHPSFTHFRHPQRFTEDAAAQPSVKEMGNKNFWTYCREIDSLLTGKDWIIGKEFSVADCYALVFYAWGVIAKLPMNELGSYTAFKERMSERPAVRKVLESERSVLVRAG
ncbi:MAG: glutathione S-transferase family protein [Deltaproteobacteria bacterium]|nr:glutathione S-transferase family protein [Deltaproteobacteria bacterium]